MKNNPVALTLFLLFMLLPLPLAAGEYQFQTNFTKDGNGMFAMDTQSGQVWFMWDVGERKGQWQPFGEKIDPAGTGSFQFQMIATKEGNGFFALDSRTGQLWYMWDIGERKGQWRTFGEVIDPAGTGSFRFQMTATNDGNGFFALDSRNGQVWFMWDVGERKGQWRTFGEEIWPGAADDSWN